MHIIYYAFVSTFEDLFQIELYYKPIMKNNDP